MKYNVTFSKPESFTAEIKHDPTYSERFPYVLLINDAIHNAYVSRAMAEVELEEYAEYVRDTECTYEIKRTNKREQGALFEDLADELRKEQFEAMLEHELQHVLHGGDSAIIADILRKLGCRHSFNKAADCVIPDYVINDYLEALHGPLYTERDKTVIDDYMECMAEMYRDC